MNKPVEDLFKASGVNVSNGGGFKELEQFQECLLNYKIVVFDGLNPDMVMFSGNSFSDKNCICYIMRTLGTKMLLRTLRLQWQRNTCVTRVTLHDNTHKCDKACFLCTAMSPCTKDPGKCCGTCNGWFLSEKCFQINLTLNVKGKLVCRWRQVCRNCSF